MTRNCLRLLRLHGLALVLGTNVGATMAQAISSAQGSGEGARPPALAASPNAPTAPRRLSDWLLAELRSPQDYPLGLSWRVPSEIPAQEAVRVALLRSLASDNLGSVAINADSRSIQRLRDWLSSMTATGRVRVALADARWLQANPDRDPLLHPSHVIVMPRRPATVTVVLDTGELCAVRHVAGLETLSYLSACLADSATQVDWAWLAQPDGKVQRYGVASWNAEKQDEPAPGTWIWAPRRTAGWPESFSERLVTFLATQGPAADPQPRGTNMKLSGWNESGRATQLPPTGLSSTPASRPPSEDEVRVPPADVFRPRARGLELTSSNWGNVGLLQTPTARMREAGYLSTTISRFIPYTQGNIFFQPFDGLETGFRYSSVSGVPYDPSFTIANQSYKDKSVDFKLRLMKETALLPEFSMGMRDITGTGLFSSEYLVASKRTGDFDWSLGVAWGYLGGRADIRNPLGKLHSAFDTRTRNIGQGGNFSFGTYFRGPMAFFGGVQYQTPWDDLILKAEYDGNNYKREPFNNNQKQLTPLNVGAVYRYSKQIDINFGIERGNTWMLGLTLHGPIDKLTMPKFNDVPRVGVAEARPAGEPDWTQTARDIATQTEWHVSGIEADGRELRVTVDNTQATFWRDRVDRIAAVLHRDAPARIERFVLVYRRNGVEVAEHVVDRESWVARHFRPMIPAERMAEVLARDHGERGKGVSYYGKPLPDFEWETGPSYGNSFGGPDGFILFQVGLENSLKWRPRADTWIQGAVNLRLVDNYDKFKYNPPTDPSVPRTRTLVREYVTSSRLHLSNLLGVHMGRLSESTFFSVYGGLIEGMFGGVGGEWLYRPFASRLAIGVDANFVKQRGFSQKFSFQDYSVATGHVTAYWDTGWNDVQAKLSAGRYLGKDIGVTVDLSRVFGNGIRVGGWATKTNLSAAQFGEGSFDKALYLQVPMDVFMPRSTSGSASAVWQPLVRDGGAKLRRPVDLYSLTDLRSDRSLEWRTRGDIQLPIPADREDGWQPKQLGPEGYMRTTPRPSVVDWRAETRFADRLHDALYTQYFRDIRVELDESLRLTVRVTSDRIAPVSLAVGRAARVALRLSPLETREIRVVFSERDRPVATYEFSDLAKLDRYFRAELGASELIDTVAVQYHVAQAREDNPLARLDDARALSQRSLVEVVANETRVVKRVAEDAVDAGIYATQIDWWKLGLVGAGLTLGSAALDNRADRFARDHGASKWVKGGVKLGNALPWLGAGAAAMAAFGSNDPVLSRTGYAAGEAAGTAFLAATGLKYLTGRARPTTGLGNKEFKLGSSAPGRDAFPSRHATVAWAVATPFAEQYHAPWLYGVAALTNLARVGSREHWFSDTVAGSVLGYAIGQFFQQSARNEAKGEPRVSINPTGVSMAWAW